MGTLRGGRVRMAEKQKEYRPLTKLRLGIILRKLGIGKAICTRGLWSRGFEYYQPRAYQIYMS